MKDFGVIKNASSFSGNRRQGTAVAIQDAEYRMQDAGHPKIRRGERFL